MASHIHHRCKDNLSEIIQKQADKIETDADGGWTEHLPHTILDVKLG